jgi:hypothetical protein
MPGTTPINQISIPLLGDPSNIESAIHTIANAFDSMVISRFSTPAARDAAISAPVFGMCCAVSSTQEIMFYNGTGWAGAIPRVIRKTANTIRSSTTTLASDPHLTFSVESNSSYLVKTHFFIGCTSTTPDFKFNFAMPSGAIYNNMVHGPAPGMTDVLDSNMNVFWNGSGTTPDVVFGLANGWIGALAFTSFVISSTSGTVALQWAQNVSSGSSVTLGGVSFMEVLKVT